MTDAQSDDALQLGSHIFTSRLIVGTGKYATYELMTDALELSGTQCITVAVRRERRPPRLASRRLHQRQRELAVRERPRGFARLDARPELVLHVRRVSLDADARALRRSSGVSRAFEPERWGAGDA